MRTQSGGVLSERRNKRNCADGARYRSRDSGGHVSPLWSSSGRKRQWLQNEDGAQLLEFALVLPLLLVVLVGIIDFTGAFNLKQKMANAAREGARMVAFSPTDTSTCSGANPPCSIESAADEIAQYMTNAGVDSSCISPDSPTSSDAATYTWTYQCQNGIDLTIDRDYTMTTTSGIGVEATRITLTYPYQWTFNHVIGLLGSGANSALPATLTTTAIMENVALN